MDSISPPGPSSTMLANVTVEPVVKPWAGLVVKTVGLALAIDSGTDVPF